MDEVRGVAPWCAEEGLEEGSVSAVEGAGGKVRVACTRTRIPGHLTTRFKCCAQTLNDIDSSQGNQTAKGVLDGRLGDLIQKIGGLNVRFQAGHLHLGAS